MPVCWIQPPSSWSAPTSAVRSSIIISLCGKCRQNIVKCFIVRDDVIQLKKAKMFQGSAEKVYSPDSLEPCREVLWLC